MGKTAVLVTGLGAVIGQGIVKSLRHDGEYVVIGLDRRYTPYGAHLCDVFVEKPCSEDSPAYWEFLRSLVREHDIKLVIPGIEQDVFFFHDQRARLAELGVPVVLNAPEVIELGRDKWRLFQFLEREGAYAIPTVIQGAWEDCLQALGEAPFLFKPRRGSGGKGQALIADVEDFEYLRRTSESDFMVQQLVGADDEEYTVAVFGFGDGESGPPAMMRRRLGPGGATWQAETVLHDGAIEEAVKVLTRRLRPLGPTNYQFRREGDRLYLLEINPRISASTSLRAALGYNEAGMCLRYFLHGERPVEVTLAAGQAVRYVEDHVVRA